MRLLPLVAVIALAGCNATMPQQQAARPTAKDDPSYSCLVAVPAKPELAVLTSKIPLSDPGKATLEMLSSKESPTEDERKALSVWAQSRQECIQVGRAFRDRYAPPGWVAAFERGQTALIQSIAALYAGGTYGQFNTGRQNLATRTAGELDAAARGAQQAQAARAAQDQNAALQSLQMMQLMQATQPKPLPMPAPIQPILNCISRPSLGSVYTTCN